MEDFENFKQSNKTICFIFIVCIIINKISRKLNDIQNIIVNLKSLKMLCEIVR